MSPSFQVLIRRCSRQYEVLLYISEYATNQALPASEVAQPDIRRFMNIMYQVSLAVGCIHLKRFSGFRRIDY